jgi:hypothetical protein
MTTRPLAPEPWDDGRLSAAFAARAALGRTPPNLPGATSTMLELPPTGNAGWRQIGIAFCVLVLAVGGLAVGIGMSGERGQGGMFRQGPTAGLKTFDGGGFSFDYPADWRGYDATADFGVGSSIAVLGTQPVDPRCGDETHVDINCVGLQSIDSGAIRVIVGTGTYHGVASLDQSDIENRRSTQITIDGMPAILEEYEPRLEATQRDDVLVRWEIARPGTDGTNNYRIEAMLREPGVAAGHTQLDALIASIRIDRAASPSPSAATTQTEAAGLRVMSVTEAVTIRDGGVDDHEIAVRGWYAANAPGRACARQQFGEPVSPLQARCPDQLQWLTQDREQLTTTTDTSTSWHGPAGPAISPDFDDLDMAWAAPAADPFRPLDLVLIGHFDDVGSARCPADEEAACRDRFVVDRIDSVDGASQPLSVVDRVDGSESSTIDDIRPAVDRRSLGRPILSIVIDDARSQGLADGPSPTIWIARVLGEQVVEHHVVFDGTDEVFEVRTSGPPKFPVELPSPEPTPTPSPAWGPWPPQNAFSVMEFKDDAGRKAFVAIVDGSGLLESVAEGVPDAAIGDGAFEGFFRDPSGAHRYRLRWLATICDREMTVSIARDVARIVIEHAPREGCDAMGVGRDLVLQFTEDVDPAAVELQVIQPTRLPEPPPEPTTMVVELGRGDSTESVLVIDHAASLMVARAADPIPNIPDFTGVRIVRAEDGGTIVMWDGLLCDRDLWISIEAKDPGSPDWIGVHGTQAETCRLARVVRAIWLDLGPVDVASLGAQMAVAPRTEATRDPGPVIAVAEALVVRSHPADDHQLQVRGWLWLDPAVYDCFVPPSPPPLLESGCNGPSDRLVADPEKVTGPGFLVWLRPGVEIPPIPLGDPGEVVIVGHFADTLAEACAASTRGSCRDVFVIEEVLPAP